MFRRLNQINYIDQMSFFSWFVCSKEIRHGLNVLKAKWIVDKALKNNDRWIESMGVRTQFVSVIGNIVSLHFFNYILLI